MTQVHLCDAALDDLDAIFAIEQLAFPHPWTRRLLAQEFEHPWSRRRIARDDSGKILGYLIAWWVADEVHILNVAVHPEARRHGVGKALLEDCELMARANASSSISLEVRRSNEGARALYQDLGFRVIGERPRYYAADQEDAVVLEWAL